MFDPTAEPWAEPRSGRMSEVVYEPCLRIAVSRTSFPIDKPRLCPEVAQRERSGAGRVGRSIPPSTRELYTAHATITEVLLSRPFDVQRSYRDAKELDPS